MTANAVFRPVAAAALLTAACAFAEPPVDVRVRATRGGPRIFVDGRAVRPRFFYGAPPSLVVISGPSPTVSQIPFTADADTDAGRVAVDGFDYDEPMRFSRASLVDMTAAETNAVSGAGETPTRHFAADGLKFKRGHSYRFVFTHRASHPRTYFTHEVSYPAADGSRRTLPLPYGDTLGDTAKMAAAAGVDLVTFSTDNSWGNIGWWTPSGGDEGYRRLDAQCAGLIAANPRVLLVPRVSANAPDWLLERDPSLKMKFDRGFTIGMSSVSSRRYRREACAAVEKLVRHLRREFPRNFAGVQITGQNSAEWFYFNSQTSDLSGYDVYTRDAFREWLAKRGAPDAGSAEIPSAAARRAPGFRDPLKDARLVDFARFRQEEMAGFLIELGRAVRRGSDGGALSLFFYGYTWELAAVTAGAPETGHFALGWLLKNGRDAFDGFSAPFSYGCRTWPGASSVMSPAESVMRSGLLWINEDDTRTFKEDLWHRVIRIGGEPHTDPAITFDKLTRNAVVDILRGYGDWWMDLRGAGWFRDERIWALRGRLNRLDDAMLSRRRPYSPEIACCADEESLLLAGWGTGRSVSGRMKRGPFNVCGATYGQYLLGDVLASPPDAKVFYITVLEKPSPEVRAKLAALKAARPAAVFVVNPGPADLTPAAIAANVRRAGGRVYVAPGTANLCAAEGFVMVQALKDGPVEIDFGSGGEVRDFFSGSVVGEGPRVTARFRRGQTRVFEIRR
ncbi:MAG: hypothetical protein J6T01_04635 [Kiritimatiellae bacterium]|nr:hypothetical protein [Kiritimatiellia bacterium]